jgi:hypothetical protein
MPEKIKKSGSNNKKRIKIKYQSKEALNKQRHQVG